jgi:hypothetical protein
MFPFASTACPCSSSTRCTFVGFDSTTTAESRSTDGRGLSPASTSTLSVPSSTHWRARGPSGRIRRSGRRRPRATVRVRGGPVASLPRRARGQRRRPGPSRARGSVRRAAGCPAARTRVSRGRFARSSPRASVASVSSSTSRDVPRRHVPSGRVANDREAPLSRGLERSHTPVTVRYRHRRPGAPSERADCTAIGLSPARSCVVGFPRRCRN